MNRDCDDRGTPDASSARYMNAYERAHARAYMDQAMALADCTIRISERIGASIKRARDALRRTFLEDPRGPDTVAGHRGMR